MQRSRFEEEMSRFEAEIGGNRAGFGANPQGFGRNVPPPPPPAVILNRQTLNVTTGPSFYASGPQTNFEAKKAKADEEDVLATLEKYEKEVKKEAKRKAKSGQTAVVPKKPTIEAKPEIKRTFVPPQLQNIHIPQSTQQRMAPAPSTMSSGLPAGVKAPPTATMTNEESWKKAKSKKKIVRTGGGQIWEDETLKDWDNNDFRIFCGDLGNDVTDEVLARVFGRYPSFQKAKVIRDRKTNKTKGYGFVSFKDPTDFTKAMREMNGKYVGSRPIKMRKSNWKDRNIDVVRQKQKAKQDMGYKW